jgi:tetratricopeptide (TPR) repeat protein
MLPGWLRGRSRLRGGFVPSAAAELEAAKQLLAGGQTEAAIERLRRALELDPRHPEAARELAVAWHALGDADQAEHFARLAIEHDPGSAELRLHLGNVLRGAGRHEEALDCCREAVRLDPALARAHNNLGNAYRDLGRTEEAIAALREAIRIDPGLWEAHYNLAIALREAGERAAAAEHIGAALERRPDFAQGWLDLGLLRYLEGDLAEARSHYDRAIAEKPDFAEAHVSRALQRLAQGDFAAGWEEYEWRLQLDYVRRKGLFAGKPRWDGSPLAGRTLLLYGEQGFGDTLQFFRYAPLAAARGGGRVVVCCLSDLKALLSRNPGVDAVLGFEDPIPPFDLCLPLLSLPRVFGTTLETVPAEVPYVYADPGKSRRWAERLAADGMALKVGLVWASGPKSTRSIPLRELAPLAGVPGVSFYSLQRGDAAREADEAPGGLRVRDLTAGLADFSDNAALLASLDLLIAADTSVAHLAGAMGMPVWTLHNDPADWRWLLDREDSPWYPTMRLFRVARAGDWAGVAAKVASALGALVRERG